MNSIIKRYHEELDNFRYTHMEPPTRLLISYRNYMDLIAPYTAYTTKCKPPEDGKTRFEGRWVIRTNDGDILEFLP